MNIFSKTALAFGMATALTACGGGGGSNNAGTNTNPSTPSQPNKATSINSTVVGSSDFVWEEPKAIKINVVDNNIVN